MKIQGFIFYAEIIENNLFFDKQWWGGLNLFRGSTKHNFYKTFLKNFVKFTEKYLCQSLFFKTFCNFKGSFPLNSEIF